jgi:predicted transcriptional regulator
MVKKKLGKVARVAKLFKEGLSVKEVAEKTGLSQRVVRSYKWRAENPEKYKALLQRYFEKRRQKKENEAIKAVVENSSK